MPVGLHGFWTAPRADNRRPPVNRPNRGDRTKVKAARRAARKRQR